MVLFCIKAAYRVARKGYRCILRLLRGSREKGILVVRHLSGWKLSQDYPAEGCEKRVQLLPSKQYPISCTSRAYVSRHRMYIFKTPVSSLSSPNQDLLINIYSFWRKMIVPLLSLSTSCYTIMLYTLFASLWHGSFQFQQKVPVQHDIIIPGGTVETKGGNLIIQDPDATSSKAATSSIDSTFGLTQTGKNTGELKPTSTPAPVPSPDGNPTSDGFDPRCPEWDGLPWVPLKKDDDIDSELHLPYKFGQVFVIWCRIDLPSSVNPSIIDIVITEPHQSLAQCIRRCAAYNTDQNSLTCTGVSLDLNGICYLKQNHGNSLIYANVNSTTVNILGSALYIPSSYSGNNTFTRPNKYAGWNVVLIVSFQLYVTI